MSDRLTEIAADLEVTRELREERDRQRTAGYTTETDDEKGISSLVLECYYRIGLTDLEASPEVRERLVKVATILIAAIQVIDRAAAKQ